jgi:DNA invertase Pin-like site-specific DNA recombinase
LHRVPLIVAKVDRLTRSAHFLSQLLEAGVDVLFCDLPKIEGPTGRFLLRQMASVAELEADMISTRTKSALQAAKARGRKLGGTRRTKLTEDARAMGRDVIAGRARQQAANVAPTNGPRILGGSRYQNDGTTGGSTARNGSPVRSNTRNEIQQVYIGLSKNGQPYNFVVFRPEKIQLTLTSNFHVPMKWINLLMNPALKH